MLYLVILALAIVAGVQAAPLFKFENPMRELDRWWQARHLTTGWAHPRNGVDEA